MANALKTPPRSCYQGPEGKGGRAGQFVKMARENHLALLICLLGVGVVRILAEAATLCDVL